MKRIAAPLIILLLAATCSGSDNDISAQIRDLQEGQKAIRAELEIIKGILLGKQPPLDNIPIDVERAPFAGSPSATVAIAEFADFQCPFCARHFKEVYPLLYADYIKTGKVCYYFLDFPLDSIHPVALKAAEAVRCAAVQGKLAEMRDRLFENQSSLTVDMLAGHGGAIGLDVARFKDCMSAGTYLADVKRDIAEGQRLDVEATPTFFIGSVEAGSGIVKATTMLKGAQPYVAFTSVLNKLISGEK